MRKRFFATRDGGGKGKVHPEASPVAAAPAISINLSNTSSNTNTNTNTNTNSNSGGNGNGNTKKKCDLCKGKCDLGSISNPTIMVNYTMNGKPMPWIEDRCEFSWDQIRVFRGIMLNQNSNKKGDFCHICNDVGKVEQDVKVCSTCSGTGIKICNFDYRVNHDNSGCCSCFSTPPTDRELWARSRKAIPGSKESKLLIPNFSYTKCKGCSGTGIES
jgi:hypothetical protein